MPASPCNRICCLNQADICLGCGRTLQEIKDWHSADQSQKLRILEQAKQRLEELPRFTFMHPVASPSE